MAEDNYTLADFFGNVAQAIATRPQKSSVTTTTTSSTMPYALEDMLMRRDKIGKTAQYLDNVLKERETVGYNIANALSGVPQQSGYGTWLGDFARAFGAGYSGATNARVARANARFENELKDLETALKFDKEMGSGQTQTQTQSIDYKDLPYGGNKVAAGGAGSGDGVAQYADLPGVKLHDLNVNAGRWDSNKYDTQDKTQGAMARLNIKMIPGRDYGIDKEDATKQAKAYEQYETTAMKGMFDVLKVLRPATDTDVLTALKAAGADPTMAPETRDMRLTNVLNSELRKAGLPGVENLKNWDDTIDYAKKYGVWDPVAASQKAASANKQPESSNENGIIITSGGKKYRVVNRGE